MNNEEEKLMKMLLPNEIIRLIHKKCGVEERRRLEDALGTGKISHRVFVSREVAGIKLFSELTIKTEIKYVLMSHVKLLLQQVIDIWNEP